jgi:hypothetical protein
LGALSGEQRVEQLIHTQKANNNLNYKYHRQEHKKQPAELCHVVDLIRYRSTFSPM